MKTNIYLSEINKLKNKPWINPVVYNKFVKRLQRPDLVKNDNPVDHICTFFLPIDITNKLIYLCHHIKAQDWIPPGGHIDKGELPIETVKREVFEELNYSVNLSQINMFDLSIKHIINSIHGCEYHYDIWHWIPIIKQDFKYTKKEYYDARWVTISEANKLCQKNPTYLEVINKISEIIFLISSNRSEL